MVADPRVLALHDAAQSPADRLAELRRVWGDPDTAAVWGLYPGQAAAAVGFLLGVVDGLQAEREEYRAIIRELLAEAVENSCNPCRADAEEWYCDGHCAPIPCVVGRAKEVLGDG